MSPERKKRADNTTELKILNAARKVFTTKGYAAARTRDIAEEAGINIALLNYYFRSKEKLFEVIMMENVQHFLKGVREILDDEETPLFEKTGRFAANYTTMLSAHPELPLFILGELRAHPERLVDKMGIKDYFFKSAYFRQLTEHARATGTDINPVHFFINTVALAVFPFIGAPILKNLANLNQEQFNSLMKERAAMIPNWVEAMMKSP